jgi:hypothetical protein
METSVKTPMLTKSEALTMVTCKMDRLISRRPFVVHGLSELVESQAKMEDNSPHPREFPDAYHRTILGDGRPLMKHALSRCVDWGINVTTDGLTVLLLNCTCMNHVDLRLAYVKMTMEYFRTSAKGRREVPSVYGVRETGLTTMVNPCKFSVPSKAVLEEMQDYYQTLHFNKEDSNGMLFAAVRPKDFVLAQPMVRIMDIAS